MEQWRSVPGYEGFYEVSDEGRVRSVSRVVASVSGGRRMAAQEIKGRVSSNTGYRQVHLARCGRYWYTTAHHLVALAFGLLDQPGQVVDHINGVRTDNRLSNLRAATRQQNSQNRQGATKRSSTGLLGAHYEQQTRKFKACIGVKGKYTTLGRFDTAEAAHAAYLDAKRRMHSGCTI